MPSLHFSFIRYSTISLSSNMSKGILLFSFVATALVIGVQPGDGLKPQFIVKTELQPKTEVFFLVNGMENFRLEFLTGSCATALLVNFQVDQNTIITSDGQGEESAAYLFQNNTSVTIDVTSVLFQITIGALGSTTLPSSTRNVNHRLALGSITHVLISGGEHNKLAVFYLLLVGSSQMRILDDWLQPNGNGIRILGTPNGTFDIDLRTSDDSRPLLMRFYASYIYRNTFIAGSSYGQEEKNGTFALKPGKPIVVHIQAKTNAYEVTVGGMKKGERENMSFTYPYGGNPLVVDRVIVHRLPNVRIVYHVDNPPQTTKSIPCRETAGN